MTGRDRSSTARSASLVAAVLLVAAAATACARRPDPRIESAVSGISESSLRRHVAALTGIGPRPWNDEEATAATLAYLDRTLRGFGYRVETEVVPLAATAGRDGGSRSEPRNLIAVLEGGKEPDRIIEVGAHYDSVPLAPGADDNASGVAGVLEIARVAASFEFRKTLRFCLFAMEEVGLVGSRAHVERIRSRGESHEGILVLEMIGYATDRPDSQASPVRIPLLLSPPRTGDFILVVGNFPSGGIGNRFERAAGLYVPELEIFSLERLGGFFRDAARSDHSPYWRAGLRGVMITDTANFRNPNYHRPSDTIDTLDFVFCRGVTRAAAAAVFEWAEPIRKRQASEER
jgi:Zn-dependent M28 family amino/carboxypeptidase